MTTSTRHSHGALALIWYVGVGPLLGAACGASLFAMWVRPGVPPWLADAGTVATGTLGLLVGGTLGALVPASWFSRARALGPGASWRTAAATAAVLVVVAATVGAPVWVPSGVSMPVVAAGVAVIAAAGWIVFARGRRRRTSRISPGTGRRNIRSSPRRELW